MGYKMEENDCSRRPPSPEPQFILSSTNSNTLNDFSVHDSSSLINKLDKGLREMKASLGENHPDVGFAVNAIGDACSQNGDFDEALRYYTESLDIKKSSFGENHTCVADTLSNIGFVSKELCMPKDSLSSFQAALLIYRKVFKDRKRGNVKGDETAKVDYNLRQRMSSTLNSIGNLYYDEKDFTGAMINYNMALKDAKLAAVAAQTLVKNNKIKKPSNPLFQGKPLKEARLCVANILNNIGNVYAEKGERIGASKFYNEALKIQIQELGEDDSAVAVTLNNIGTMNFKSGELHFALKSYRQVLKMRRLVFGQQHASVADVLVNIAMVHERNGQFRKAEETLAGAFRIACKAHGDQSVKAASILCNLGDVYTRSGRQDIAMGFYTDALIKFKKAGLDEKHPLVQSTSKNISNSTHRNHGSQDTLSKYTCEVSDMLKSFVEEGTKLLTENTFGLRHFYSSTSTRSEF